jgi:adenylyltransferase/sulfurtransferase
VNAFRDAQPHNRPSTIKNGVEKPDRYARQTRFAAIGAEGQTRIAQTCVVLFGCGALGGVSANLLVRAGIGHLRLVDRDYVELSNLQRQPLFDEQDVVERLPKAIAAAARLSRVNSEVVVEPVVADVNTANIESLIADADLIVDGLDNFETRFLINDVAIKHQLPWVYGGVIGSYGMTMTIRPGTTACLRCVFPEAPTAGSAPTCETAGVIGPAVDVIGAIQAAEVLKLAIDDHAALNTSLLSIDLWTLTTDKIPLGSPRPGCPACQQREFSFLNNATLGQELALCGRDAIQVSVHPPTSLDLGQMRERLSSLGSVQSNRFLLRFDPNEAAVALTIFPDGRAIVHGTTDNAVARSAYARYVGT